MKINNEIYCKYLADYKDGRHFVISDKKLNKRTFIVVPHNIVYHYEIKKIILDNLDKINEF